jgi:hypothetical protein
MKHSIFIIILLISSKGFAQFEYIDQSDLYKKYSVQEVNAFDNDSGQIINDEKWLIDTNGRIYWHKLLETEDDSTFSLDIYFFEKDLLVKAYEIGIWNTRTNKLDTGQTTYFFNSNELLEKIIYSNTRNHDTLKLICEYNNNILTSRTYYNAYSKIQEIDSIFYYSNLNAHIEQTTYFFSMAGSDIREPISKKLTYYDTTGTINLELDFEFENNGISTLVRSKSFVYKDGKLIQTINLYLETKELWGTELRKTEEYFFYDSKGFVIKKEWYSDNLADPYLLYTYDYK